MFAEAVKQEEPRRWREMTDLKGLDKLVHKWLMNFNGDHNDFMLLGIILYLGFKNPKFFFFFFQLSKSFVPSLLREQGQKKSLKDHQFLSLVLFV